MSEARRVATYADLHDLPDNLVGEIVNGELYASPRPAPRHANAGTAVGADVRSAYGRRRGPHGPGGWHILFEPEVHLDRHVLVPDIAGWRRERMPRLPEEAYFTSAPDWVCEVLSPSTTRLDRVKKLPVYATFGVGHVWLVDPTARTLEVYRLHEERWLLLGIHGGDQPVRAEPFEALEMDLTEWWLDPDAPSLS